VVTVEVVAVDITFERFTRKVQELQMKAGVRGGEGGGWWRGGEEEDNEVRKEERRREGDT
jgi:hypothetical protein